LEAARQAGRADRDRGDDHELGGHLPDGAQERRREGGGEPEDRELHALGRPDDGLVRAVLNYMIVVMFLAQAGDVPLTFGQIALGMALAILLNMGTITVPGGFPVVAMFLATSLDLPFEAVGLLIAVDWFTGVVRTFLNVNGDTFVAMLVANADDEIDRDVYNGTKIVQAEAADLGEHGAALAADRADCSRSSTRPVSGRTLPFTPDLEPLWTTPSTHHAIVTSYND